MKSPSKLLLAALVFTLGLSRASIALTGALTGSGQYGGQTLTCSSDDGKRNYCNVDTRGGVRLSRQISGSPCIETQTWGYDSRGLWVDRGCRAEFVVGNDNGGNWGGQGQTITCSSDDGRRNYCNSYGVNPRNIFLSRQISGSPCIQNQTWGVDRRGLWVDRGCRAEFSIGGGNNWRPGQGAGQYQTITCSSDNGGRNYCAIPYGVNPNSIGMTRQISGSPCVQGQTWGVDQRGIWVDRGCRAEFSTGGGGNWRPGQGAGQYQTITCSSNDGGRNYCTIPYGANPDAMIMTRQISGSPCIQGQTWGVDQRGLWVDRGCRAEFRSNY